MDSRENPRRRKSWWRIFRNSRRNSGGSAGSSDSINTADQRVNISAQSSSSTQEDVHGAQDVRGDPQLNVDIEELDITPITTKLSSEKDDMNVSVGYGVDNVSQVKEVTQAVPAYEKDDLKSDGGSGVDNVSQVTEVTQAAPAYEKADLKSDGGSGVDNVSKVTEVTQAAPGSEKDDLKSDGGSGDNASPSPVKEVTQAALPQENSPKSDGGSGGNVRLPKKTTSNSIGVLKRMFSFVSPDGGRLTAALVALIVSSSTNLAFPYFVGKVVDRASAKGGGNWHSFFDKICTNNVNLYIGAAGVFACGAVASYIRTYNFDIISHRVGKRMKSILFAHLLRLDMSFYDKQEMGSGEFVHVLSEDVEVASKIYTNHMPSALRGCSSAINGSIMLLRISPKLTLLSLGMVPVIGASAMAFSKRLKASAKRLQNQGALATAFAHERLSGLRTVKAFTAEEADAERYKAVLNSMESVASHTASAHGLFMGGLFLSTSTSLLAVLYRGGGLVASGTMSVGSLMSFSVFTAMVGLGFSGVGGAVSDIMKGIASAERVFDLLDEKLNVSSDNGAIKVQNYVPSPPLGAPEGLIKIEDVYFRYPTRPENVVLNGLNLEIFPGEMLALTGPSGGGKSTLMSLISRLYEPDKGRILLDGVDIASQPEFSIRNKLAIVEQEPSLFSGSIHDNIRYALPSSNFTDVVDAAKKAHAHEFIMEFPEGYDTEVGAGGRQISGGQKTRIALARAFLKGAPLLIIDEAIAHLDGRNEKLVQDALNALMANRTTLIIAHRRDTVACAKKIAVMEEGRIVQIGTYAELMLLNDGPLATYMSSHDLI